MNSKVISMVDIKRKKIEENLEFFQERYWEWVFAYRWKPCPHDTFVVAHVEAGKYLVQSCGVCCSYFIITRCSTSGRLKQYASGRKVPHFRN